METIYGALGAAILMFTTFICVCWMEHVHKRALHEMQEQHEKRMAEWRAEIAQVELRIAEPPADE